MSADETSAKTSRVSAGEALRAAREKLGLTQQDVSTELRLGVYQIEALENENYGELPGPTYVRGYLKAYARLLKLDEAEVVPTALGETEAVTTGQYQPAVRQARSSDRHVKLISVGIAGALIVFFGAWWQNREDTVPNPPLASAEPGPASGGDTGNKELAVPALTAKTSMPVVAPAQAGQPAQSAATPDLGGPRQVGFQMRNSSWLDVRDAADRQLANRLVPAGQSISLEGDPPFRVFVGNAAGVSVVYSGESFDASAYQTGLYARFVVGE